MILYKKRGFSFNEIKLFHQDKTLGMSFTASELVDSGVGRPELGLAIVT